MPVAIISYSGIAFCVKVKLLLRDRTPPDLNCLAVPTSRWRPKITCRMAITNSLCLGLVIQDAGGIKK